jgi:hypothetical protein
MAEHLFMLYSRPRPEWYELADTEQAVLATSWETIDTASTTAGARLLGTWSVRGQCDYSLVHVWVFPSVDAVLAYWSALVAAKYPEWFSTSNVLGAPVCDTTRFSSSPNNAVPTGLGSGVSSRGKR